MPSCPYVNWSGISSWPDSRFQVARPTFSFSLLGNKISELEQEIVEHRRPAEELNDDLQKYLGG